MKLLIDIPDTTYAFVKQLHWVYVGRRNCKTIQQNVINAIKFGVEQPQGEWAFDYKGNFYCDQCGKYPHDQYATTDFCPNCGTDMRGSK